MDGTFYLGLGQKFLVTFLATINMHILANSLELHFDVENEAIREMLEKTCRSVEKFSKKVEWHGLVKLKRPPYKIMALRNR